VLSFDACSPTPNFASVIETQTHLQLRLSLPLETYSSQRWRVVMGEARSECSKCSVMASNKAERYGEALTFFERVSKPAAQLPMQDFLSWRMRASLRRCVSQGKVSEASDKLDAGLCSCAKLVPNGIPRLVGLLPFSTRSSCRVLPCGRHFLADNSHCYASHPAYDFSLRREVESPNILVRVRMGNYH
jgi:hypothetical protein